jgi:hypothetical protein
LVPVLILLESAIGQMADSSLKCNGVIVQLQLRPKNFVWSSVAETFSGAVVEVMHDQLDVLCGDGFEGQHLRKELANQPIHGLIGIALPRRIRMDKEEVHTKRASDAPMLGELTTVIRCQGCARTPKRASAWQSWPHRPALPS